MKEKLDRLAKGIVDTEVPEVLFEPASWKETVQAGASVRHEIYVTSENSLHIKGLVYSTNTNVEVIEASFGGLRNRVHFEVHTDHLEPGDQIEGAFCFVTNGGEKKLPYSFRVENGGSAGLLGRMGTLEDFAAFARRDWATALHLFDYRDFLESPFMQDLHVRSIYEGLRGGPDRNNMLEEFLVAGGVKKPVEVYISSDARSYDSYSHQTEDHVRITRVGWGYFLVSLEAEGEFIRLSKNRITNEDFEEGSLEVSYQIDRAMLHRGKNFGSIRLSTTKSTAVIEIEAMGPLDGGERSQTMGRGLFSRYLSLRLDYECGRGEQGALQNQMLRELENLSRDQYAAGSPLLSMLQAELYLMEGRREPAYAFLQECRGQVLDRKAEQVEYYCFYLYLTWLYEQRPGQKETLILQLRQYWEEDPGRQYLFLLLLKLDETLYMNPGELFARMGDAYACGCHSPFLYQAACILLIRTPGLLKGFGMFEMQVLNFGIRREMIPRELAGEISRIAAGARHYHGLAHRILASLYQMYPEKEVLEAVCCMMIKGDLRREADFPWYESALSQGISLTRLYEYYLFSLPESYGHLLPREILIYFSYEKSLDQKSREVLYRNILAYCPEKDPMYQAYEREMEQFAMEQLFQSRINSRLAVIYQHVLYKDMIDDRVARVLPSVLHACRVECRYPQMRYVVLCYEELKEEAAYPLKNGIAYVPVFSGHSTLLFQDGYGNRYGNVRHTRIPVMPDEELEKRCFEIYPEHPMLRLKACRDILDQGDMGEEEAYVLERAIKELDLHPLFRKKLMSCMIDYYQQESIELRQQDQEMGYAGQFLIQLDKEKLNRREREKICESLIHLGYYKEAYGMLKDYGCEKLRPATLTRLCTKMIMQNLFAEDAFLLHLAWQVFASGQYEGAVLDYLCEHYNGASEEMYQVLLKSVQAHIETYDLEERLLDQMLFSGETGRLDSVFHLYYTRKKPGDSRIRAYLTVKCTEYFVEEKPVKEAVFGYLEKQIEKQNDIGKVPTIYLLALTKYYAGLASLEPAQVSLCRDSVGYLLKEKLLFAHYKQLSRYVKLPDPVMNQAIVQYNGARNSRIELKLRVLPHDTEFHTEDMQRVFQGFYIRQKILFDGEVLEYKIEEITPSGERLSKEGRISSEEQIITSYDKRFTSLNQMEKFLKEKREQELKETMKEYLVTTAAAQKLFGIK